MGKSVYHIIRWFGPIAILAISWGFDNLIVSLRRGFTEVGINPLFITWSLIAANILVISLWLMVYRVEHNHLSGNRLAGLYYLVIGALITLFVPTQMTVPANIKPFLLFVPTRSLRAEILNHGFNSYFVLSGAFLGILGILLLISSSHQKTDVKGN